MFVVCIYRVGENIARNGNRMDSGDYPLYNNT